MAFVRRFLIPSSLTRLIRKERGSERVVEGHFPIQGERQSHVRIERGQCHLVLTSIEGEVSAAEDWTEVPRSHAEALLDVCPGTVNFERSCLPLRDREALVDRFITPGPLDLVSVEFATQGEADAFLPPVWFGSEVTGDDGFTNRMMAIAGRPDAPEAPLSNAALETVLDLIESRPDERRYGSDEHASEHPGEDNVFERLRRLAAVRPASPLPAAAVRPMEPEPPAEPPMAQGVARLKPRRPVMPVTNGKDDNGDERLAGVIQGLSEALSQSGAEKDERYGA
jgi:CYTH domain-containing protein